VSDATTVAHIDIQEIQNLIPHRFPFLMIDAVRDVVFDTSAVGIKNVTINEPQFQGHFPGKPVMPGVMIVEAMAQTAAVLVNKSKGVVENEDLVYFMSIDNTKFRQIVQPGDVIELHVTVTRHRGPVWKFHGEAKVQGKLVTEADFSAMIVPPEKA